MPQLVKISGMADLDLASLLDSWTLHLRAERKSPQTITSYLIGVRAWLAWCDREGVPPVLGRAPVNAWVAHLLDDGAEATTARARQLAVRRFSAWCAEEGETERDELIGLKPPKLDVKVTERLTDDQCSALIKVCAGKTFRDRRDEAIVRLLLETGTRAGELVSMTTADIDLGAGLAVVRRGKGFKGRRVPFGPATARAIDRYLRMRRAHRLADTPPLWLGDRGRGFGYNALYGALKGRAEAAGIPKFNPHVTRHTFSQRWLDAGGSEGSLMSVAGWSNRAQLDRYTKATAAARAAQEARSLNLGDFDT
jgi:integrase/recombinase XerD